MGSGSGTGTGTGSTGASAALRTTALIVFIQVRGPGSSSPPFGRLSVEKASSLHLKIVHYDSGSYYLLVSVKQKSAPAFSPHL